MASSKPTKAKSTKNPTREKQLPGPMIPERNRYRYKPTPTNAATARVLKEVRPVDVRKSISDSMPEDTDEICKLVHVLASSASLREQNIVNETKPWKAEFERALANHLPVREHHVAFLTHNTIVTIIGAVVARGLEQATRDVAVNKLGVEADEAEVRMLTLDLLADRYYVRNIACHDSSKTSAVENAAYAGIMAVNMQGAVLKDSFRRRSKVNGQESRMDRIYKKPELLTTPMANIGFKHHYENNPHHPEHYASTRDKRMPDVYVVEAVVDGLACVFERTKPADVKQWLEMFNEDRFPHPENRRLAHTVLSALRDYLTDADYKALEAFRDAVFAITGESCVWECVTMTGRCDHKPLTGDSYSKLDISTYFEGLRASD